MAGKGWENYCGSEGEGGGSFSHRLYCANFGLLWFEWFESQKFRPIALNQVQLYRYACRLGAGWGPLLYHPTEPAELNSRTII